MMAWVLVLMTGWVNNPNATVVQLPFQTEALCKAARAEIVDQDRIAWAKCYRVAEDAAGHALR